MTDRRRDGHTTTNTALAKASRGNKNRSSVYVDNDAIGRLKSVTVSVDLQAVGVHVAGDVHVTSGANEHFRFVAQEAGRRVDDDVHDCRPSNELIERTCRAEETQSDRHTAQQTRLQTTHTHTHTHTSHAYS